jgi:hypothetical protein
MTRQAWELVVMNYRGLIAWKVAYILKFEEMETKLGPAGARTAALFDRANPAFQGLPNAQIDLFLLGQPRSADNDGEPRLEQVPLATTRQTDDDEINRTKIRHLEFEVVQYTIGIEPAHGNTPIMMWVAQNDRSDSLVLPREHWTFTGKGKQVLLLHDPVPDSVLLRAYEHLPAGHCTQMALTGLRRYLDKSAA